MIIYQSTKQGFQEDVMDGNIETVILDKFQRKLKRTTTKKEIDSWRNSMVYMNMVMSSPTIPGDAGVSIETQIPQTAKRIDFIISGRDDQQKENVIIIELKQWSEAELTEKDAIVKTWLGGRQVETSHPSYQAWSYAALLSDYNESIYTSGISLLPCAYLHNYEPDHVITNPFYQEYLVRAPVFLKTDIKKLQNFISRYVKNGDKGELLYRMEKGQIRPSKQLVERLSSMLEGNKEFIMIDDQKVVYETALQMSREAKSDRKKVLIVEGGPGTGKSVVAINLLVAITTMGKVSQYVTKNAAPRAVYEMMLTGKMTKSRISNLFKGSGAYLNASINEFDTLIVDEAHRLNEKSGLYKNLGENQIKEIMQAAKCSIFFIDEDQRVTFRDIGTKSEIKKWAYRMGCDVQELELASQFRCNGSDGYLAWLDNMLQIRETANTDLKGIDYDFRVVNDPNMLEELIVERNEVNNRSRMVAGYCWDWKSKKDPNVDDIILPEYNFSKQWNLDKDGSLWIKQDSSINEIGCIHTCQGLELDYVGVIIGEDLVVRDGKVIVNAEARSRQDSSIRGYKKMLRENPERAEKLADLVVKNTYRTLMTRGMKGCYVYTVDEETGEYFKRNFD